MATEQQKIDFRVYIGIVFFRWKIIAVCFLYCLLGGVLYIQFAPKEYLAKCKIMIYRDPHLEVSRSSSPWESFSVHTYLFQSDNLRNRAVKRLLDNWGKIIGNPHKMMLDVEVKPDRKIGSTLNVSVKFRNGAYGAAFLSTLMDEHKSEWESIQRTASSIAAGMLEKELARLEEQIRAAEDDLIEYQRLHDIARVEARGSMESRYLQALMERRSQLTTELLLMESQFPALKTANAGVISHVRRLTRETGAVKPVAEAKERAEEGGKEEGGPQFAKAKLPAALSGEGSVEDDFDDARGWHNLRARLARLGQREKELAADLKPEHPQLRALRKEKGNIQSQLELSTEIELGKLKDRHRALKIQLNAVEAAEYKWQAKNLLASQRRAELKRIAAVVGRFESNYNTLYRRLHDMRVSEELKAEHYRVVEPVATDQDPIWPDPAKILIIALILGLGSGFGIAFVAQVLDNKIQSINDVENVLGIPFLGGVPFWVHSGLEKTIRPIVTEEYSTGAVEAYRALRTGVLSALDKMNEKIVFVTSADSKEGKTLTVLNIAILIAQMNKKVLLVDMDVRRGRLHRSLGLEREPGVADVLKEDRSLKEVIMETRIENLNLVPTGCSIKEAAELLQSSDLASMFSDVQDDYDYILIDTSPVLRVTDTAIIASQGFGVVLYVARVNHTPKPLIRYSLDILKDTRILGMVMNSIEMNKISSLYYTYQYPNYAYYSNAYAYGYDYYYDDQSETRKPRRRRRGSWEQRRREVKKWLRRTFLPVE